MMVSFVETCGHWCAATSSGKRCAVSGPEEEEESSDQKILPLLKSQWRGDIFLFLVPFPLRAFVCCSPV